MEIARKELIPIQRKELIPTSFCVNSYIADRVITLSRLTRTDDRNAACSRSWHATAATPVCHRPPQRIAMQCAWSVTAAEVTASYPPTVWDSMNT